MFQVFTDGGSHGNPGPSAWAMIVYDEYGERKGSKSGTFNCATNNIAEMTAILEALKWANKHKVKIEISTDSDYSMQGCQSWMHGWAKNGWINSKKEVVKNKELWQELYSAYNEYTIIHGHPVTMIKVKGHSGNPQNDEVDALVQTRITELEMAL